MSERIEAHKQAAWFTTGGKNPFLPELLTAIGQAHQIHMAIAFIKLSGLELIWNALEDALSREVKLRILTGDYLGLTDPAAMRRLLRLQERGSELQTGNWAEPEIKVFESRGKSFHPKVYLFVSTQPQDPAAISGGQAFVGSSNLSASALTDGIEWNLRIDHLENPARFVTLFNAFDELFHLPQALPLTPEWIDSYQERRKPAGSLLRRNPDPGLSMDEDSETEPLPEPTPVQIEALTRLDQARRDGARRGLVVLATGLGKTWLSAFDARQVCDPERPRLLFVAHREEILRQAEATYLRIFPDARSGWYMGSERDTTSELLFASIQTLGRQAHLERFAPDAFDYIVIDEFHHAAAGTYRHLLRHFRPRFLLGLTATPDRTDQVDILSLCDGNLVHAVDLLQGIDRRLLAPFVYFGIQDRHVDYARIGWRQGRFDEASLEAQVMTERRSEHILKEWRDRKQARTLAFCVSKRHADYMADYFERQGVAAVAVHSTSAIRRHEALEGLVSGRWAVVFSVDLFNEGVDVPAIDTVMMLRPTESRILFLQQLGRGLRKAGDQPDKRLHVLDFLGNHKAFLNRPQALFGLGTTREGLRDFVKQLEKRELPLPAGCELNYDLAVLDFFRDWGQTQQANRVLDLYVQLRDALGSRPSAQEMYQAGGEPVMTSLRKEWGSWLELLSEQGDLSEAEQACLQVYRDFFADLETTSMTKSYKLVTLQALLELDGFRHPPAVGELALRAYDVLGRRSQLRGDLQGIKDVPWAHELLPIDSLSPSQQREWLAYWRKNPIQAWCGSKSGSSWFRLDEAKRFRFNPGLSDALAEPFHNLLQEFVDYKLFRYAPQFEYRHALPAVENHSYSGWRDWLQDRQELYSVPLFATDPEQPLQVRTRLREDNGYRLLCRHPEMERVIIETIEQGLQSLTWTGLLFILGFGSGADFSPLYLSYTERSGSRHAVSDNIRNIRTQRDKFARWGDNFKYRFGDLSQALFKNDPDKSANGLEKWVPVLFANTDPPILTQPVTLMILPWHNGMAGPSGSPVLLPELKRELAKLLAKEPNQLLT